MQPLRLVFSFDHLTSALFCLGPSTTNSSTQARFDSVSFEIDTLPEEDSAAPADDKYLNFLAHTSVADLAAPGTLPCGGGVCCIHLDRLKEYLNLPGLSCGVTIPAYRYSTES
jgi:hypothetical protein